jgi:hypothetical protein
MDSTWQEEKAEMISDERIRPVMERLAEGGPSDEGENSTDWVGLHPIMGRLAEDREPTVEWSAGARIWLIEHPSEDEARSPASRFAIEQVRRARAIPDEHERERALQGIARDYYSPEWVPPSNVIYQPDGDARDLGAEDFYTEVVRGAALLVRQGWSRHEYPELEYLRQKAGEESGWRCANKRDSGERSSQEIKFKRLFKRFERRYRYQAKKRRAELRKSRETTPRAPM